MRVLLGLANAAPLLFALSGCAPTYLDTYRRSHPDWSPPFPAAGMSLQETVAGVYLPHDLTHRTLTEVQKIVIDEAGRKLSLEEIEQRSEGATPGDAVVLTNVSCSSSDPLFVYSASTVSWYQLRAGKLASWNYGKFGSGCRETRSLVTASDFAATRADLARVLAANSKPETAESLLPPADSTAQASCPGLEAYVATLRQALVTERSTPMRAIFSDVITATVHVEPDGALSVLKLRPVEGGPARQIVQDFKRVSSSPARPIPPDCARGTTLDVAIPP